MFGIIYSYATRKRRLDVATFITGTQLPLVNIEITKEKLQVKRVMLCYVISFYVMLCYMLC